MTPWNMTLNGNRLLVVPAHRSYAAAMAEDHPLTGEELEQLRTTLRRMDTRVGNAIHYGPGEVPLCGEGSLGAHWADKPGYVSGCEDFGSSPLRTWPTTTTTKAGVSTAYR